MERSVSPSFKLKWLLLMIVLIYILGISVSCCSKSPETIIASPSRPIRPPPNPPKKPSKYVGADTVAKEDEDYNSCPRNLLNDLNGAGNEKQEDTNSGSKINEQIITNNHVLIVDSASGGLATENISDNSMECDDDSDHFDTITQEDQADTLFDNNSVETEDFQLPYTSNEQRITETDIVGWNMDSTEAADPIRTGIHSPSLVRIFIGPKEDGDTDTELELQCFNPLPSLAEGAAEDQESGESSVSFRPIMGKTGDKSGDSPSISRTSPRSNQNDEPDRITPSTSTPASIPAPTRTTTPTPVPSQPPFSDNCPVVNIDPAPSSNESDQRELLLLLQYFLLFAAALTLVCILIYSIYYITLIRKIYSKERVTE